MSHNLPIGEAVILDGLCSFKLLCDRDYRFLASPEGSFCISAQTADRTRGG
jgi:hypothetical protein